MRLSLAAECVLLPQFIAVFDRMRFKNRWVLVKFKLTVPRGRVTKVPHACLPACPSAHQPSTLGTVRIWEAFRVRMSL